MYYIDQFFPDFLTTEFHGTTWTSEMFDVIWNICDLANLLDIDLEKYSKNKRDLNNQSRSTYFEIESLELYLALGLDIGHYTKG